MHGGILVLHQESNRVPCTGRHILNHWTTGKSLIQLLDFIDFCQVIHDVWPTRMAACSNLGVCQNHLEDLINTELGPPFKISDSETWRLCQTQPKHSIHCLIGPSSSHSTHIHQKSSTFRALGARNRPANKRFPIKVKVQHYWLCICDYTYILCVCVHIYTCTYATWASWVSKPLGSQQKYKTRESEMWNRKAQGE